MEIGFNSNSWGVYSSYTSSVHGFYSVHYAVKAESEAETMTEISYVPSARGGTSQTILVSEILVSKINNTFDILMIYLLNLINIPHLQS